MTESWQPPKDVKPWMVCAACILRTPCSISDVIILGARHFDEIMREQANDYTLEPEDRWEQGFIDQWGRFYNRKEAMKAVKASGQPFNAQRNCGGEDSDELYSEGLY